MTVASTAAPDAPVRPGRPTVAGTNWLLRLELRRTTMMWMLPVVAALFWLLTFRRSMGLPPIWSVRAISMQGTTVAAFLPTVVGAAAWTSSRERRRGLTDLLTVTARPRWGRQLIVWAGGTGWALAAYLVCVGAMYAVTAGQGAWGGPLWWPAVVGAASVPALTALGSAAGTLVPSRFTPPLAAVGAFVALEAGLQLIHGDRSSWQISPLVAGPWELGTSGSGVATFYPYLPDLPVAQLIFLAGVTATLLGTMGLPAGSGGRRLRRSASVVVLAGLLAAGTAAALAGTGRLDAHGMIAIPALHDAADDRPVPYTPICTRTSIPVCLHPAYAVYLPAVATALEPVLSEVAGLPGTPVRISQAAAVYRQGPGNGVEVTMAGPVDDGTVYHFLLPGQVPGPAMTVGETAAATERDVASGVVRAVVGGDAGPAQRAVMSALLRTPVGEAARRFAALPAAARRAWLEDHLSDLRAGRISPEQLP
jgi:hypothetical protein